MSRSSILFTVIISLFSCSQGVAPLSSADELGKEVAPSYDQNLQTESDDNSQKDSEEILNSAEQIDPDALSSLISRINSQSETSAQSDENIQIENRIDDNKTYPTAIELWNLTNAECGKLLKDNNIKTKKPDIETPFIKMPLLLTSPVNGVEFRAKWPNKVNSIMDCRLIAALIPVADYVSTKDVEKVEFYSTWRPIAVPPENCKKNNPPKRCISILKAYENALNGKFSSQHQIGLAMDIRYFTKKDQTVTDVLEDYEKNFHNPPCEDNPQTEKGIFLKEFACHLNKNKLFNVVLTPNANEPHKNHFHIDITPKATWYIIR
ncbi:MAG: extensin family protein [Deltaproteobacteria bacterium]|nr:extensin family protein [Deltaproteobacteria bacterium]